MLVYLIIKEWQNIKIQWLPLTRKNLVSKKEWILIWFPIIFMLFAIIVSSGLVQFQFMNSAKNVFSSVLTARQTVKEKQQKMVLYNAFILRWFLVKVPNCVSVWMSSKLSQKNIFTWWQMKARKLLSMLYCLHKVEFLFIIKNWPC